jgi:hypothetical protein
MEKNLIPITVAFGFAILISYWIKGVLDNNNFKVNPLTGYFRDTKIFLISQLRQAIIKQENISFYLDFLIF